MTSFLRNGLALLGGALALGACKDNAIVGPINSTAVTVGPLSTSALQTAITGVLQQSRANAGLTYFYVGGVLGRDVYRFDPSESRYIYEAFTTSVSNTSFFGGGQFANEYTTIRAGATLLANLDKTADSVVTTRQKQAIRGLVHTLQALDYYRVEAYHDSLGTAIQPADSSKVGAIVCAPAALAYISALLDTANTELIAGAAGSATQTFGRGPADSAIVFPSGFRTNGDFTVIENFRRVLNRGLKGKVEVYRALGSAAVAGPSSSFSTAITALNEAIGPTPITTQEQLNYGPYYQYSTAPGELANPLADANIFVNTSFVDSAQAGDRRLANQVITLRDTSGKLAPASYTARGFTYSTPYKPVVSSTGNPANFVRPIPIIRIGELVLLRAQAKIGLNQYAAATADLNIVRVAEGGLPAITTPPTTQAAAITALLYEKRYSLFLQGPERLVDLRTYGRLSSAFFKKEVSDDPKTGKERDLFQKRLRIPQAEADVRGGNITPSCPAS
jgi:starch-binding outer membrane protein, SusD/RagB family